MRTLIAFAFCAAASAGVVDRVAVVVGTNVITQTEVDEEVRLTELLNGQPLDLSAEARRTAAERLVDQTLIRSEMEISNFAQPPASEADAMLHKLRQSRFPSESAYQAMLRKYGVSEDEVKAHLRWQLAAMRFTDQRFRALANTPALPPPQHAPAPRTAARMARPGGPPPSNVDEALDQWLADARSRTRVEFKQEAFR